MSMVLLTTIIFLITPLSSPRASVSIPGQSHTSLPIHHSFLGPASISRFSKPLTPRCWWMPTVV
jgi:hypothetical protein